MTEFNNTNSNRSGKPDFGWVENVSRLLDSKFKLPGTNFKFGLDPIIGLIPFVGDVGTFIVSSALLVQMIQFGVSRKVVIIMTLNILVDFIIGSIPILGWIFDFYFKANDRNIRLLKEHYNEGKHQGSGTGILLILGIILLGLLGLVIYGIIKLISFIIGLF